MKPQLSIVGTGHHYQFGFGTQFGKYQCSKDDHDAFMQMLRDLINSNAVEAIAEELNEQALREVGGNVSVPQLLAQELRIPHLFCDPDRMERQDLGIREEIAIVLSNFPGILDEDTISRLVQESWNRREEEWIRRLRSLAEHRIVFVCGSDHIRSFAPLAAERGFLVHVVHENWEANWVTE